MVVPRARLFECEGPDVARSNFCARVKCWVVGVCGVWVGRRPVARANIFVYPQNRLSFFDGDRCGMIAGAIDADNGLVLEAFLVDLGCRCVGILRRHDGGCCTACAKQKEGAKHSDRSKKRGVHRYGGRKRLKIL